MSFPPRTPFWAEIEDFCRIDGWHHTRTTDHKHFEKDNDELLATQTSLDGHGTMSQNRFGLILRTQLRVSRREFWEALDSGKPVDRPVAEQEPAPPAHEPYVLRVLKNKLYLTDEEINELTLEEGRARVVEYWSQPKNQP